ncbi:hypothetical protein CRYUN_Cryun09bG0121000 [Craigia yunnanensis]
MAHTLAFKRLVFSNILPSSMCMIRSMAIAPSTSRLFNTNAMHEFDDDGDERDPNDDHRHISSVFRCDDGFLSDVLDHFFPMRSINQVLNMMNQFMENPFLFVSRGMGGELLLSWDAKETQDALNLRIDIPEFVKEDVKVFVEQNTLTINGEGVKESEDEDTARRYTNKIDLSEKFYKTDQIKAEMKNGVLKVATPKIKEERNDGIQKARNSYSTLW